MTSVSYVLANFLKYAALIGYVAVFFLSTTEISHLPTFVLAAGVTFLSLLRSPFSDYIFNWSLFSLLVYMLITYHEMDGCILDNCEQPKDAALISIISTILAWTSVNDRKIKKQIEDETPPIKVAEAVEVLSKGSDVPKIRSVRNDMPTVPPFPKLHWV